MVRMHAHPQAFEPDAREPGHPIVADAGSDVALVLRARQGDRTAHSALYQRHAATIFGSLVRLFRSREEAEDALHDAFVIALDKLDQLREPSQFRAWVMRAAVRVVFRRRRRQRILSAFFGPAPREEPMLPPGAEAHSELRELFRTLSAASIEARLAWTLRNVEGYALQDVALACDCSLATVKRRISEADELIERKLGPRLGPGGV